MSIQQIKTEASTLSHSERRELIGYLVTVGRVRSDAYWDRLATKVQDANPENWVADADLDSALGLDRSGA